jgi:hypothetical protein
VKTKFCKKCCVVKDLEDFYVLSSSCKECVKKASRLREEKLKSTPEGLEKERARHRDKYYRLGYKDIYKPTPERKKEIIKKYKEKYPEKQRAKNLSQDLKKKFNDTELHHWSYNEEDAKDCIELSVSDHNLLHRFLVYDQSTFYYKNLEGNLLDTKEKHKEYIEKLGIEIK